MSTVNPQDRNLINKSPDYICKTCIYTKPSPLGDGCRPTLGNFSAMSEFKSPPNRPRPPGNQTPQLLVKKQNCYAMDGGYG